MSFEKNLFEEKKTIFFNEFLMVLEKKSKMKKKFREGQTDREKTDAGQKVIKKSLEFSAQVIKMQYQLIYGRVIKT